MNDPVRRRDGRGDDRGVIAEAGQPVLNGSVRPHGEARTDSGHESLTVTPNPDGTLQFAGGRWIAVDSLRFVRSNGSGYIVFRADSAGTVQQLFAGGFWGWQKVQ